MDKQGEIAIFWFPFKTEISLGSIISFEPLSANVFESD